MKFISNIPSFLKNKYFLSGTFFIVWLLFFDHNDFFTQLERRKELNEIKASKAYYSKLIEENRRFSNDLEFNASALEKYAREKYLMKKDNEDLYLVKPLENK